MDEDPGSIGLRDLRQTSSDTALLKDAMREVKQRLGFIEESLASVSRQVDRIDDRGDRIERRLNLIDA